MKITIYELLGMIKDGKAPKKIKYHNEILYFDDETKNYYNDKDMHSLFSGVGYMLNDEVEILEEQKKLPEKIKDILRVDDLTPPVDENMCKIWTQTIKNQNKINEICDYLKAKVEN